MQDSEQLQKLWVKKKILNLQWMALKWKGSQHLWFTKQLSCFCINCSLDAEQSKKNPWKFQFSAKWGISFTLVSHLLETDWNRENQTIPEMNKTSYHQRRKDKEGAPQRPRTKKKASRYLCHINSELCEMYLQKFPSWKGKTRNRSHKKLYIYIEICIKCNIFIGNSRWLH